MNKTTEKIVDAFLSGQAKRTGNDFTNGKQMYLFNNLIAEHKDDGLWITNAGWQTKTTKERLNALPNVYIQQKKGKWYLNGEEWEGQWIRVNGNPAPYVDEEQSSKVWDKSTGWVTSGGYRGYEEPVYAVCGANDTGMWEDSPCKSNVAEAELKEAKEALKKAGIPTKLMTCETSNVFCVHHYLIVRPIDKAKADKVMESHLENNDTELLYVCKK